MANPTAANGWLKEESTSKVLTHIHATSAVEALARREPMSTRTKSVPRFDNQGADVVAEGGTIPVKDPTLDEVVLTAIKFANRFQVSLEGDRDAVASTMEANKLAWADSFSRKLDNACLGVTAAANGTTIPYESVYFAATAASRVTATAGDATFEDLNTAFSEVEDSDYFGDLVLLAHPAFRGLLRNLKDAAGDRVVVEPLGGVPTIFGYEVRWSKGAKTSATATHAPAGNPLLIVANAQHMILGVRDGVESAVSDAPGWETDEVELKMRARRAFAPATADAFWVIEKTAV